MSKLDRNSVDKAVERYLRKIILTKSQHTRVESAVSNLSKILADNGNDVIPDDVKIYLQGSFKTRTTLKPRIEVNESAEYDADLAVESTQWDHDDPGSALEAVYHTLVSSSYPAENIEIKASCVRLHYAEGPQGEKFHVDVVPILYHGGKCWVASRKDDKNEWKLSDPSKLSNWFNAKAATLPTFRAQYLIIKRLAQVSDIDVPSIAIQKLVSDSYQFKPQSNRYIRELLNLCRTATDLLNDPNYMLTNPINDDEDLRERIKPGEVDDLKRALATTVWRIEQFGMDSSDEKLADVFGYGFPPQLGHEQERSLRSENMYFDCDYADNVDIVASCENGQIDGGEYAITVGAGHQNHPSIKRSVDRLVLQLQDSFKHHTVKWQVMNDPSEVEFDIRGKFYDSNMKPDGYHGRSESVNWVGKHWVRAYVMKDDRCKHISSRFMVNVVRAPA